MSRSKRLFLLEGVFFCGFCAFYAYVVSIMLDYGYNEVQCGYVTMLQFIVMLVAEPIYGQLIDRSVSPKKMFLILCIGGLVTTPLLPLAFSHGFVWSMLAVGLVSALDFCVTGGVMDTWITHLIRKDDSIDYGVIRSAGSIFYATTALITGYLIAPLGIEILFIIHAVFLLLAIIMAWRMDDPHDLPDLHPVEEVPEHPGILDSFRVLFGNRAYVVFLISGMLYYFATRSVNTFMQVILNDIGGDVSAYGLSVFLYCVGEYITMNVASRLLRRGMKSSVLLIVSLAAMAARLFLLSVLKDMLWVMITQVFLSLGFGCFLRFNIEYVAGLFPPQYNGRAILVCSSVTQGFGCILGNLAGGYLLDGIGSSAYCALCGGILILALAVFLLGTPKTKAKRS